MKHTFKHCSSQSSIYYCIAKAHKQCFVLINCYYNITSFENSYKSNLIRLTSHSPQNHDSMAGESNAWPLEVHPGTWRIAGSAWNPFWAWNSVRRACITPCTASSIVSPTIERAKPWETLGLDWLGCKLGHTGLDGGALVRTDPLNPLLDLRALALIHLLRQQQSIFHDSISTIIIFMHFFKHSAVELTRIHRMMIHCLHHGCQHWICTCHHHWSHWIHWTHRHWKHSLSHHAAHQHRVRHLPIGRKTGPSWNEAALPSWLTASSLLGRLPLVIIRLTNCLSICFEPWNSNQSQINDKHIKVCQWYLNLQAHNNNNNRTDMIMNLQWQTFFRFSVSLLFGNV